MSELAPSLLYDLQPLTVVSLQPWLDGTQPLQQSFEVAYGIKRDDLVPPGFDVVRSIVPTDRGGLLATSPTATVMILETVLQSTATINATDQAPLGRSAMLAIEPDRSSSR